jgi:hypothetical protein
MNNTFDHLLAEYRLIWNNRLLESEGELSKNILIEAIERELNDENSHPRIRRSRYEKYFLATKRILESTISNEAKLELIHLHKYLMENEG